MYVLELVFFISIFAIIYAYFGYPCLLFCISLFSKKPPVQKKPISPSVSFIITASNEEQRIVQKLENTLAIKYPKEKLQIIVASDGSTDKTDALVSNYRDKGIELHRVAEKKGKENAQREAVNIAAGEIMIFSDVATILNEDAVASIVQNFADESVGCVSSTDKIIGDGGNVGGEGGYVAYEMRLRKLESKVNTLVGLSGSFFAARKEVCADLAPDMQSDFRTLLSSVRQGFRGVVDPQAIGYYRDLQDKKKEFSRKVRTVIRGLAVFFRHLALLNFFRYGLFSFQLFSHKLMRWLVPWFMLTAFAANCVLVAVYPQPLFSIVLLLQLLFYAIAVVGTLFPATESVAFIRIPKFFVLVNYSILVAWIRYIAGERMTMWTPSQR